MSASLTQCRRSSVTSRPPIENPALVCHKVSYDDDHGEFAHTSAATVATKSTAPEAASVSRKRLNGRATKRATGPLPATHENRSGGLLSDTSLLAIDVVGITTLIDGRLPGTFTYRGVVNESISLGKIAGIRVGMNWSLFAIFGLIAWSLADGRFPYEFPGYTDGYYWAGGVLTATIFFACLLGHEMGHALVARARGVEVEGITLWLFGGVAKLKGDPKTASEEFQIAIAGPLVSLALAGAFAASSVGLEAAGSSDLLVGIFAWLWRINAILALFNMLPAFPLDGGRVFRALLWHWKGKSKATKWAARTGRAFGFLMISAGILEFAVRQSLDGVWIAFLGYFLLSAATAEERVLVTREALVGVRVAEAMSPAPEIVPGWTMVEALLEEHGTQSRSHFAVASFDGSISGVVAIKVAAALAPQERSATRTDRVAIPISQIAVCHPDETLTSALDRMNAAGSGRALVFDEGALVGEITGADLQRILERPKASSKPT